MPHSIAAMTTMPPGFEGLTERAVALARGEIEPVVPRHASTVVLMRDGAGGLEVYLLRRVASMAFAAGLPSGQRTRDVGGEADRVHWMQPGEAVVQAERGEMVLLPPTLATLTDLCEFGSVAEVLAVRRQIRTVAPKVLVDDLDGDPKM